MTDRLSRVWLALLVCAVAWTIVLLQWGHPLHWDELEFFRATRWIALGQVPFRDFWEHHLPLQWLSFAPVAGLFSGGAGTQAVLALRWAQIPMWVGTFAVVMALMRRAGIGTQARWAALVVLLSSAWFVRMAIQYRVDVPGHLAYLTALWLIVSRRMRWAWFTAGALFSLAVLANMRLAPLVVVTVGLLAFWRADEERWAWNGGVFRVVVGGLAVAASFVLCLKITGAMPGFVEGVIWYNRASDALVGGMASSFLVRLAGPILQRDPSGSAFLLAGAAGVILALRRAGRPGLLQMIALLAVGSLALVAALGIEYDYHFHTPLLLLMPLAALAIDRLRAELKAALAIVPAAGLALNVIAVGPELGANLAYQDLLMKEVDGRTTAQERVWDSCGYALRREPAYRYWFLPAGVRLLADHGRIEPYDLEQIIADPPAAIVFNDRTRWWMTSRPRLARYVSHHYVPLYQHLWLPGMSAMVGPGPWRTSWVVPKSGRYDVYASELLQRHPWFTRWSDYGLLRRPELAIPLDRLPPAPASSFQWRMNGAPVEGPLTTLDLQRGARLELHSALPGRAGVFVVPHGVKTLSRMPEASQPFF